MAKYLDPKADLTFKKDVKSPVDLVVDGDLLPFAQESANRDKILIYERAALRFIMYYQSFECIMMN